jgi:hypothetical protein
LKERPIFCRDDIARRLWERRLRSDFVTVDLREDRSWRNRKKIELRNEAATSVC